MAHKITKGKNLSSVNKTSDKLGDAIYRKSSEKMLENLKKGQIKY